LSVEGKTRPVEWWESRARFGRYTNNQGFQAPPDPGFPFDVLIKSQIDVERLESEWLNSFFLGKWSTSTVGVGYRNEEGNNQGVFRASRHVPWVLFEEQLRFFDRLFITGGFRVEDDSQRSLLPAVRQPGAPAPLNRFRMAELALKHRLPSLSCEINSAEAGTLLFYGPSVREGCRRAATYADKILKSRVSWQWVSHTPAASRVSHSPRSRRVRTKAARSARCPRGICAAAARCSRQYVWMVPGG
jgi:hypothetical protein